MADLKKGEQQGGGATGGIGNPTPSGPGEDNRGAEFGKDELATRGTDRDLDRSGTSKNQAHGHPREERGKK